MNLEDPTDLQLFEKFERDLLENSKPLDPEINDLIDEYFWELIEYGS
jgi:hypothetical protein